MKNKININKKIVMFAIISIMFLSNLSIVSVADDTGNIIYPIGEPVLINGEVSSSSNVILGFGSLPGGKSDPGLTIFDDHDSDSALINTDYIIEDENRICLAENRITSSYAHKIMDCRSGTANSDAIAISSIDGQSNIIKIDVNFLGQQTAEAQICQESSGFATSIADGNLQIAISVPFLVDQEGILIIDVTQCVLSSGLYKKNDGVSILASSETNVAGQTFSFESHFGILKETKTQHVLPGVEYHVSMNLIVASSAYAEASHESTLYDFKTANPNINLHIQIKYVPIH